VVESASRSECLMDNGEVTKSRRQLHLPPEFELDLNIDNIHRKTHSTSSDIFGDSSGNETECVPNQERTENTGEGEGKDFDSFFLQQHVAETEQKKSPFVSLIDKLKFRKESRFNQGSRSVIREVGTQNSEKEEDSDVFESEDEEQVVQPNSFFYSHSSDEQEQEQQVVETILIGSSTEVGTSGIISTPKAKIMSRSNYISAEPAPQFFPETGLTSAEDFIFLFKLWCEERG